MSPARDPLQAVRAYVNGARMNSSRARVHRSMRKRRPQLRTILFYSTITAAIVFSFGWQMLHGICPVP